MKKITKKSIVLLMTCTMVFTLMPMTVSAANVCKEISGNSKTTKTFTVETGKGWIVGQSITFNQTKGKITGMWTKSMYAKYDITIRYAKNNKIYKTYTWDGGKSKKIKLGKNTKYKVTLKPYTYYGGFHTWITPCYWNVKKTKNINLCN